MSRISNGREQEFLHDCKIVGDSPAIQHVHELIGRVAPSDSTVMIYGESGTGKELVAHTLHLKSRRASRPFVAIDCASLSESLLQSELFGHEKGSFTGAVCQKIGKLELADQGTVFLDEIAEIDIGLQAKLLRAIQEREIERIGGTERIQIDIRILAATNRNLDDAVRVGSFRKDLFFRLNVVAITLPSLRERREDILPLADYFIKKFSKKTRRTVKGLCGEAQVCLMSYDWPGNVRELENVIERAVVLGSTELIDSEDLPEELLQSCRCHEGQSHFHDVIRNTKKTLIQDALAQCDGDYRRAAQLLGLHPSYVYRLMRSLNIPPR